MSGCFIKKVEEIKKESESLKEEAKKLAEESGIEHYFDNNNHPEDFFTKEERDE